ncbi:AarF/UbiB family protein, partial [Candidatus Marithioploca araucensis]|nr:AarF/UbiB family protein [Candidatus Marithioploca araucensis]
MKIIRQIIRLLTIYRIIVRYGLDELLLSSKIFRPLRLLAYFVPGYWLRPKHLTRGMRIRLALEELGPIFVKFGQILSTRRDLLPDDIALELAKLQDKVAPFSGEEVHKILEKSYARPLDEVFADFDMTHTAAASVAQVHAARLHNGRKVVVKVLRPGIKSNIRKDIELLYLFAELAQRYWTDGRRLRPLEVVAEFEKTLYDELDLIREAANATQLRRNFKDSDLLYVPEIEWDYTLSN